MLGQHTVVSQSYRRNTQVQLTTGTQVNTTVLETTLANEYFFKSAKG